MVFRLPVKTLEGLGILIISIEGVVAVQASQAVIGKDPPLESPGPVTITPWSVEIGSGLLWSNVRDQSIPGDTMVPVQMTLARAFQKNLLHEALGGLFEGTSEATLKGYGTYVINDAESRIAGFTGGMRYNFTHAQSRLVPFFEANVGLAWADAHPYVENRVAHGLGQDFNFNFSVGTGLRYDLSEHWFTRAELEYTHYSNAGLSEPQHPNLAIDGLGFICSVGYRF